MLYIAASVEQYCDITQVNALPENEGILEMNNLVLRTTCFAQSLAAVSKDSRGVTAMEYGLIAALIAVVIVGSITTIGTTLDTKFQAIVSALQ